MEERLERIFRRKNRPEASDYLRKLIEVNQILDEEPDSYRLGTPEGRPGGIIRLNQELPTVIVPDLHARMDFFLSVLHHRTTNPSKVLDLLVSEKLQIVCVGDGFHAEGRAAERWRAALQEYIKGYTSHNHMDAEMRESLGLMEMVLEVKTAYPSLFHFLKGNHENIANEDGYGNYPFGKFAYEGEMVTGFISKFYGEEFLQTYYSFEKKLPLLAIGRNFLVSHAEPRVFYTEDVLTDYHNHPEAVYDLTWTGDGDAEQGSVQKMLSHYLGPGRTEKAYYFGGHRSVEGKYNLRAEGRYVQIHNPERFTIAVIRKDGDIDLDSDIVELHADLGSNRE